MECRVAWSEDRWNGAGERGTESEQWAVCRGGALLDCRVVEGVLLDCRAVGLLDCLLLGMSTVGLSNRRADALALLRPEYCPGEGVCCKSGRESGKPRFSLIGTGRRRCWMRASCIFLTTENNAATGVLQRCFRSKACLAPELLPLRGGCRRFGSRLSRRIPGRQILSSSTVKCRRIGASNVMR